MKKLRQLGTGDLEVIMIVSGGNFIACAVIGDITPISYVLMVFMVVVYTTALARFMWLTRPQ